MKPTPPPNQSQSQQQPKARPGFENEGEGNKTAARRFNEAQTNYAQSGRSEAAAEKAKHALEGEEGKDLRAAEEFAKGQASPIERSETTLERPEGDVDLEKDAN